MRGFSLLEVNVAFLLLTLFFIGGIGGFAKLSHILQEQNEHWKLRNVYLNYCETKICDLNYSCRIVLNQVVICSKEGKKCRTFL